jgi:hypothetical protein
MKGLIPSNIFFGFSALALTLANGVVYAEDWVQPTPTEFPTITSTPAAQATAPQSPPICCLYGEPTQAIMATQKVCEDGDGLVVPEEFGLCKTVCCDLDFRIDKEGEHERVYEWKISYDCGSMGGWITEMRYCLSPGTRPVCCAFNSKKILKKTSRDECQRLGGTIWQNHSCINWDVYMADTESNAVDNGA